MVQKEENKRRGRPRSYDPDQALQRIMEAFWKRGYSGTSLDDISAATGLNRPSLYAAFGDKRELYLKALAHYHRCAAGPIAAALAAEGSLHDALMGVYRASLSLYFSDCGEARGCFVIGTATTEAVEEPEIGSAMLEGLKRLDQAFTARIEAARAGGEIPASADAGVLAGLASSVLYSIAVRARAGSPREELEKFALGAADVICGKSG